MERYAPEALEGFQRLVATGAVEILAETSHHALAFLGEAAEFRAQVEAQAERVERVFGRRPTTFRNTELIIARDVAQTAEALGFTALLGEGADHLMGFRDATRLYRPEGAERLRLLLRCYRLSDDIAFRFADRGWKEWPLTPQKFAGWLEDVAVRQPGVDPVVGLFMDYETVGEHQDAATGILRFLEGLPEAPSSGTRASASAPRPRWWRAAARPRRSRCRARSPGPTPSATCRPGWATTCSAPPTRRSTRLLPAVACGRATRRGSSRLATALRPPTTSTTCARSTSPTATCTSTSAPTKAPTTRSSTFMNVLDDLAQRVGAPRPVLPEVHA